ncbi:hypothetical protein HPO_07627 [Hyphomonas polymorpha PS728]|uniref:Permease n=1 Tax=Hyphomonas polymorpha PS728 TaxID=1280954 RepID=A0A062VKE2_9PROT|nr:MULTISPECIES: AI-2E family transporter [Hyphomonas]AXE64947.1 hypothetical protein BBF93_12435 [Hyphomonas sp. CACIAM 19H1]KCZ99079.1 hypothetical protein HPO_07627 [Hyphomonas polymorpha PS728]
MPGTGNLKAFTLRLLLFFMVLGLAMALWVIRDAILLIFLAVLIATAIHGIADALMRLFPLPRPGAVAGAALILVSGLGGVFWIFGSQIAGEVSDVFSRLPEAWTRIKEMMQGNTVGTALVAEVEAVGSGASPGALSGVVSNAGGYALPLASGLTSALLVLFIAGFLTRSAASVRRGVLLLLPAGTDEKVGEALDASARALKKWLLGITIDMVVIAVLMGIILWAFGVPAFIGLALIAGLSQFVPTVGPLISSVPGILLAFTVSPMTALWVALAYVVVSQLESALIYPLIQEKAAAVSPALILISILCFGMLFGMLGVLLATPLLVVLSVFIVKLYVQDTLGKQASYPGQ